MSRAHGTILEPTQTEKLNYDAEHADVLVLGAGVVGVCTAYALARRGLKVALADRRPGPALDTSYANGAQLSYAYSDALGSPALLRKLPALMLGADPLFAVRSRVDPDMIAWGLRFLAACSQQQWRRGTMATLQLAMESQQALHAFLARHPLEFGHATAGKMHLYYDRTALAHAEKQAQIKRVAGITQHVLGAKEAQDIEPALRNAPGLAGVVYSPEDEVGDPHRFAQGMVEVLSGTYGVRTFFGFEAREAEFSAEGAVVRDTLGKAVRARVLVVALGPDAPAFLRRLNLTVPILPMKGYSFTAPLGEAAPKVSLTDTSRKIVFCRLSGRMRVAGVAELGARDTQIDERQLAALVTSSRESLPLAVNYSNLESSWAGLRPMTPTSTPIISSPRPRLVLNVGHGMLGWTLAMGSAERAAAMTLQALNIAGE